MAAGSRSDVRQDALEDLWQVGARHVLEHFHSSLGIRPHPAADCCVLAPASANTLAKLALGIADNRRLRGLGEKQKEALLAEFS